MKILADQYLYKLDLLLPPEAEITFFDPAGGFPEAAIQHDALLIRTVTKINHQTLPQAGNLRFIGTATAGYDHLDLHHLQKLGIEFARAEGCNAQAVAEYIITSFFRWGELRRKNPYDLNVGVVGCGNTGSALIRLLKKLGIEYVAYDPPKAERDLKFTSAALDDLLASDVLSFHVPLDETGTYPTFKMCSSHWLENRFELIINAARGGVVDEKELLKARSACRVKDFILDVWEGEPLFSDETAAQAFIATPHIAGYSREAKWRASRMVVSAMCSFFGLVNTPPSFPEPYDSGNLKKADKLSFSNFLWENNQIDLYDRELRKLIGTNGREKAERFSNLRSETPTRFEYGALAQTDKRNTELPFEFSVFKKDV